MPDLVVGVDAGGTATRAIVASSDGSVLGTGNAAGANQRSSGGDPGAQLAEAVRSALGDADPAQVRAGVFGIAGAGTAGHAAARGMAESAWRSARLPGRPTVVTDIAAAFAAGTPEVVGRVLIAGTGAVAAAIRDGEVSRRCDGYGWLLGDEGSAVWLGREAVRAALAAVDGRGEPTALVAGVTRMLLSEGASASGVPDERESPDALAQALIAVVYERSPAQLGLLAPVVTRTAGEGDPVAGHIVATGTERLLAAVDAVRQAVPRRSPVVLSGTVLRQGAVAEAVRAGLAERAVEPLSAGEGALGAAALALRGLGGDAAEAAHATLLRQ